MSPRSSHSAARRSASVHDDRIDCEPELRRQLRQAADPARAAALQRYFREPIASLGVSTPLVEAIAAEAIVKFDLSADERLALADGLIDSAKYHEDFILAVALARKVVQRYPGDDLLETFERWIRCGVSNWAQCDDLCLKVIYEFLLGHPESIRRVADWTKSDAPWVRRAGNVALVKFIKRQIGSTTYRLPIEIVLGNADRLLDDPDDYVQKSVGWLLKVAAVEHPDSVMGFLTEHVARMDRGTFRYALERVGPVARQSMMALKG